MASRLLHALAALLALAAGSAAFGTSKPYPKLKFDVLPDVEVVQLRPSPPVWLLRGFLTKEDCAELIAQGRRGLRPKKVYSKSRVRFDDERLRPLSLVAPILSAGAYGFHDGDLLWTLGAFAAGLFASVMLKAAVQWYVMEIASSGGRGGARFAGRKWQLGPRLPDEPSEGTARARLLSRVQALCGSSSWKQLEPPFLTCYCRGEGQGQHLDSKELPTDSWSEEDRRTFIANGGQRMVQCLCYLNDVDSVHGGATLFHNQELGNLHVQPEVGAALVFCTAFADGSEELRLVHSAEDISGDVEKWVVPVWALQGDHADWQKWP